MKQNAKIIFKFDHDTSYVLLTTDFKFIYRGGLHHRPLYTPVSKKKTNNFFVNF